LRRFHWILLIVAAFGLYLRLGAIAGELALTSTTGYDDGVYFSASALLVRGTLPYRDFVFVHPPAILYALAPVSWLPDPRDGFAAARVLASVIGAANIFLIGAIVARASNPAGGVIAALLYAGYPDAVVAERSPYLEPFLNFACLLSAWLWLRPARKPVAAGIAAGLACAVKFWAGVWVIAAVIAAGRKRMRDALLFVAGGAAAGLAALGPLALAAPRNFVEQTLRFQLSRPPDGVMELSARLRDMADSGHRAATLFALVALVVILVKRGITPAQRFFTIAMLLTVAGFLASSSYWNHYNSHLAASQCAVAGLGAAMLLRDRRWAAVAAVIVVLAIDFKTLRAMSKDLRAPSGELMAVAQTVPQLVPKDASFFAFDPTWSLVSGRLPDAPPLVDSYGAMLLTAVTHGQRYPDTGAAFRGGVPQPAIRTRLDRSDFVLLGWRGHWQLDEPERAFFTARFRCVNPEAEELCVWQKRDAIAPPSALEANVLQFGDGWYGREGLPPTTWRWMAPHASMKLPAMNGKARLELDFEVPLDALPVVPNVSIHLDGIELDRFAAKDPKFTRAFELDSQRNEPHMLTITADRSFSPARDGRSGDTRELALKLTRIAWRRIDAAATSSRR
jgi:Dolichyl-phosphate-mannose-protein mannosyltransferase